MIWKFLDPGAVSVTIDGPPPDGWQKTPWWVNFFACREWRHQIAYRRMAWRQDFLQTERKSDGSVWTLVRFTRAWEYTSAEVAILEELMK